MKNLTQHILTRIESEGGASFDSMLSLGAWEARKGKRTWREAHEAYAVIRERYGFARKSAPLLTAPEDNLKLDKGVTPSYGLTLQHYVQRLSTGLVVNACPWAGESKTRCAIGCQSRSRCNGAWSAQSPWRSASGFSPF
jgi:hypothetical protein